MRILFSSTRGSGHLQPLLPYVRGLLDRNHEVVVAAPADVSHTLRDAGFAHAPFDHPGDDALAPIWARLRGLSGDDAVVVTVCEIFAGLNAKAALPKLQETIRVWRPDLVVRESIEFAALVAADVAGVPHACVQVHLGSVEERLLAQAVGPVDGLRRHAGLAPDGGDSLRAEPIFTAFPASLDVPSTGARVRTPFRVRAVEDKPSLATPPWAPAADKTPLLYITFGTIAGGSPHVRAVYRTALDAVAGLPVRALLTTGNGMEPGALGDIPANVHVEAWVPQRDILPHVTALVCHGGSGTVVGALGAGLPMVVVPLFADQPDNARRIVAVGAGIALSAPDAHALRAAIESLLGDAQLRRGARKIADDIAALPTMDSAVDALVAMAAR